MEKRIFNGTEAGNTGLSFTGNRQPVSPMPIPLRHIVRTWCNLNGIFMSEDGQYITWSNNDNGKEQLIKLYLNYHKMQSGKEVVLASNARKQVSVNVTRMMAVEHHLQRLSDSERIDGEWRRVIGIFNQNLVNDENS